MKVLIGAWVNTDWTSNSAFHCLVQGSFIGHSQQSQQVPCLLRPSYLLLYISLISAASIGAFDFLGKIQNVENNPRGQSADQMDKDNLIDRVTVT